MKTKEILKKISTLETEILELKDSFPYLALVWGEIEELPSGIYILEDNSHEIYTSYELVSDNFDAIRNYCIQSDKSFTIFSEGVVTLKKP